MEAKRKTNNPLYLWDLKLTIFTDIFLVLMVTVEGSIPFRLVSEEIEDQSKGFASFSDSQSPTLFC